MHRRSVNLLPYLDVVLVILLAVPALALGAPAVGYLVGATAWIALRAASVLIERRIALVDDLRRRLGMAVAFKLARVWVLACAIIAVGVAGSREDALTAALVIFGAFSVMLAWSAFEHVTQTRSTGS